ncbi:MAG: hypothetical protein WAW96_08050 [Alphaproteobacteria bacterium]
MRNTLIALLLLIPASAGAVEFKLDGYGDIRFVIPPSEKSYLDGGLGKFRFGSDNGSSRLEWTELLGRATARFTPGLTAVVVARIAPDQTKTLDLLESYIRYRPVSMTPWRWNFKAGAFFPPISLENTEIGWTSPWTLTPSAINSWVGDELRTIGASSGVEYRMAHGTLSLDAALFGWNDPAGVVLAYRGWAFDDRPSGIFEHIRLPDVVANEFGVPAPWHKPLFKEIDGKPGWYVDGAWDDRTFGRFQIMRYDNNAELDAVRDGIRTWRTQFWSGGYANHFGPFTLLAQGMTGETAVAPTPAMFSKADFDAAYALIGWQHGKWRLAWRYDWFKVNDSRVEPYYKEYGDAYTIAANWEPRKWLRVSAESLWVNADRDFREDAGLPERTHEAQVQFGVRIYY